MRTPDDTVRLTLDVREDGDVHVRLGDALETVLAEATQARVGRSRLAPEPEEVDADSVLAMVCDLLDRKLFETLVASEVTQLSASRSGFENTVAGVLDAWPFFRLTGCLLSSGAMVSQSLRPVARSNAAMPRFVPSAAPVVMKIRFAHTIGEPLPVVSSFVFHFTFCVSDHVST